MPNGIPDAPITLKACPGEQVVWENDATVPENDPSGGRFLMVALFNARTGSSTASTSATRPAR